MSTTAAVPSSAADQPTRPFWREALAPYAQPHLGRSIVDLATSVLPYLALWVLMYLALDVSYLLVLALAVPAGGFLVRTFIVFHDCAHGSFLRIQARQRLAGRRCCGLLVYSPFRSWRHDHAVHHATAGDLDRRGVGDVRTLTVAEYQASPWRGRLGYRLFRNPLVMFGHRADLRAARRAAPGRRATRARASAAACCGTERRARGGRRRALLADRLARLPARAGARRCCSRARRASGCSTSSTSSRTPTGRTRGDWSYADAALRGSSYLKLPKVLQFFTGNIGLHHVHHLNARIPNYNLQRAHDENPIFHDVPTLSFWDGLRAVRLKLWDEGGTAGDLRRGAQGDRSRRDLRVSRSVHRDGRPRGPRVHLLADRSHLPAQPRGARRLQRRQVRRRLLAEPRGGAAAQARVRGRADRDRAGPARARPGLRLGPAARLRPRAGRQRASG